MKELIKRGADPNTGTVDGKGYTPLHAAFSSGKFGRETWQDKQRVAHFLLDHGADPTVKTEDGKTPFDIATDRYAWGPVDEKLLKRLGKNAE